MGAGTLTGVAIAGAKSISGAGEVNGDGVDDLIVGSVGESYLFFGRVGGFDPFVKLEELGDGEGSKLSGITGAGSSAGDINADGIGDIIFGVPSASPNGVYSGASYIVFGRSDGFGSVVDLSTLDGTNGFALNGVATWDLSGWSFSSAGDVNGDGIDDLIVGAPYADANGPYSGKSYVIFGHSGKFASVSELSDLDGENGFVLNGIDSWVLFEMDFGDQSGWSVSGAGDVNGDGTDDLIIGAPEAGPNGYFSGESYVVFGQGDGFATAVELSSLDGANGVVLNGVAMADKSGSSVSGAGDVNGDGIDDFIIGAGGAPNGKDKGASYVVFGRADGFPATIELSSLDGSDGFVLKGSTRNDREEVGLVNVSGAGDVNGDGLDDLIIGAPHDNPDGLYSGQSYIVFGRAAGFPDAVELSSLDGTNGLVLNGVAAGDISGSSVSGAGDINDDGIDDFVIAAWGAHPNGMDSHTGFVGSGIGVSYVVFGGADNLQMLDRVSGGLDGQIDLARVGSLLGADDSDEIVGTEINDQIFGLRGWDVLAGAKGDDKLFGGRGNDVVKGNAGDDILRDGSGEDTLFGGSGADRFTIQVQDGTRDIIKDFTDGTDLINLRKWDIGFDDLTIVDKVPGRVRIEIYGEALTVKDGGVGLLVASDLTVDDFLF